MNYSTFGYTLKSVINYRSCMLCVLIVNFFSYLRDLFMLINMHCPLYEINQNSNISNEFLESKVKYQSEGGQSSAAGKHLV